MENLKGGRSGQGRFIPVQLYDRQKFDFSCSLPTILRVLYTSTSL